MAAATGARRSEVIALRWSNLDLDRSVLTIARGLVVGPDGVVEKGTKTHSIRRIALDAGTVSVLRQHRERAETAASKAGLRVGDGAFMFTRTPDGEMPWFPDSVSRAFRRQCELVGIDNARLHDLRHYVATRLLGSGVDVRTVAGRLGHRNAATTLNVYSHFLEASDREAANVLAGLLSQEEPPAPE